jgi:hypothetical protein
MQTTDHHKNNSHTIKTLITSNLTLISKDCVFETPNLELYMHSPKEIIKIKTSIFISKLYQKKNKKERLEFI